MRRPAQSEAGKLSDCGSPKPHSWPEGISRVRGGASKGLAKVQGFRVRAIPGAGRTGSDQSVGASGQPGRGSPQRGVGSLGNQGHLAVRVAGRGRPLKATPLKGDCMCPSPHRPFHLLGLVITGTCHSAGPRKSSALPPQKWGENEKRCTKMPTLDSGKDLKHLTASPAHIEALHCRSAAW